MFSLFGTGVRTVLGVFLAAALGLVGYFMATLAIYSEHMPGAMSRHIALVCGFGVGGGVGAFCGWAFPVQSLKASLLLFLVSVVAGVGGAYASIHFNQEIPSLAGIKGNPALAWMLRDVAVAANVPPLLWSIVSFCRGVASSMKGC
jgi:hypothetical protein